MTPSLELGILAGETRAALLALAGDAGYEVETGSYPLERLRAADEVVHVVLGARGDAGRRGRRRRAREPRGGRHAPAGAPATRHRLTSASRPEADRPIARRRRRGRRYAPRMEKLRLGGMALQNGVLVHGPTSWGAAVRLPDGSLEVGLGREAAPRRARLASVRARAPAPRRGVRGAPGRQARPAGGTPAVRAPRRRGRAGRGLDERRPRPPLVAPRDPAGGGRGDRLARPRARRAAGRGADLVSRRRARLDRHVRDG